ncbi:MAG: MoxR family ATPase [Spirochaetaceae bacterium]|nr:MAG: MoxR family ATPase [Spirochaetaceae bacterium]
MNDKNRPLEVSVEQANELLQQTFQEVSKRIIGQRDMLEGMITGLLTEGHVLLEGVPGLAKTLAVKTLAEVLDAGFKRIQFTPDLLPADLIGTMIYRPQTGDFVPRKGPIFTNIILADEINRSPAKVQSALLEAMEERQVTLGTETYGLEEPFLVLATQNPIEHEGTYPLPEAQLDRFILKLYVPYPSFTEEKDILKRVGVKTSIPIRKVLDRKKIETLKSVVRQIHVDPRIEEYIVNLVQASREKDRHKGDFVRFIEYGGSPRASIYLFRSAKAKALLEGRAFVIPEDVKALTPAVLRHRIILTYEAEAEDLSTDQIIGDILKSVDVP